MRDWPEMRPSVVEGGRAGGEHRAIGLVRMLRRDTAARVGEFSRTRTADLGDDRSQLLREFRTWGYDLVRVDKAGVLSRKRVRRRLPTKGLAQLHCVADAGQRGLTGPDTGC